MIVLIEMLRILLISLCCYGTVERVNTTLFCVHVSILNTMVLKVNIRYIRSYISSPNIPNIPHLSSSVKLLCFFEYIDVTHSLRHLSMAAALSVIRPKIDIVTMTRIYLHLTSMVLRMR